MDPPQGVTAAALYLLLEVSSNSYIPAYPAADAHSSRRRSAMSRALSEPHAPSARAASIALLETLTQADAVPGHEEEVLALLRERWAGLGTLGADRLGSLFCTRRGASDEPRILIDSHVDEVGFIVQRITPAGHIKFLPLGSWWPHALLAQRVRILTAKGKVPGVIGSRPPHVLKPAERERVLDFGEMYVDVGAESLEEAGAFGVQPGCPIVPDGPFRTLANRRLVSAKAFDNRVGVALVTEVLERLSDHPNTVIGSGSVQEEVGLRGARSVAEIVRPDLALVLEGPYADDAPPAERAAMQCRLGGGVHVRLYDPTRSEARRVGKEARPGWSPS